VLFQPMNVNGKLELVSLARAGRRRMIRYIQNAVVGREHQLTETRANES